MRRGKALVLCIAAAAAVAVEATDAANSATRAHSSAIYNLARPKTQSANPQAQGGNPQADFVWFPASPQPNEAVLLGSTSADATSPLVSYAWDVGNGEGFVTGGPTLYTHFSTYAPRSVRLRVTDGSGATGIAVHTIRMSNPPAAVLQPFPLVRIVGIVKRAGVKVRILAVRMGAGAVTTVTCRGGGCPTRAQRRAVAASNHSPVWVAFPRLEHFLRAGVVLEVRVSKAGRIGSYTRFLIRRHKLPARSDSCLEPSGTRPMVCPAA
jgi:hypothetical protein